MQQATETRVEGRPSPEEMGRLLARAEAEARGRNLVVGQKRTEVASKSDKVLPALLPPRLIDPAQSIRGSNAWSQMHRL